MPKYKKKITQIIKGIVSATVFIIINEGLFKERETNDTKIQEEDNSTNGL